MLMKNKELQNTYLPVGRDCPDLRHLLLGGDGLADVRQDGDDVVGGQLDALAKVHRVHPCRDRLPTSSQRKASIVVYVVMWPRLGLTPSRNAVEPASMLERVSSVAGQHVTALARGKRARCQSREVGGNSNDPRGSIKGSTYAWHTNQRDGRMQVLSFACTIPCNLRGR